MAAYVNPCKDTGIYKSLEWCPGQTSLPGIRQRVFYIPKKHIVKWPELPKLEGAVDMATVATYKGDFTLASEKKWLAIDILSAKSNTTSESQGEKPSKTFLNKSLLKYAGTDAAATGFCRQANIDELIFAVQQRDGKFRIQGSEAFEQDIKISQTSGEGDTGTAGTDLEVSTTDVCPAPFYVGKLETEMGDISGADGSPHSPG